MTSPATSRALNRHLRQFHPRVVIPPSLGGGEGGAMGSIDVAASNAPPWQWALARYHCDGDSDDLEIQAALEEAEDQSSITLSSGSFHCRVNFMRVPGSTHLRGQGMASTWIFNHDGDLGFGDDSTRPLIRVDQDAELSDLSIRTTTGFDGICVTVDYGLVHDVWHVAGDARHFLYFTGTIQPVNNLNSWGTYPHATGSMIFLDEGWYEINGINASIRGTTLRMDSFGHATINNVRSDQPGTGGGLNDAIVIMNAGGVTMSNVSVRCLNNACIRITNYPLGFALSNAYLTGNDGIVSSAGFGLDEMDLNNVIIEPLRHGIDLPDVGNMKIQGLRIRRHFQAFQPGYGIRVRLDQTSSHFLMSDFDIVGFDERGIDIAPRAALLGGKVIIHDGWLRDIDKDGVLLKDVHVNLHDVHLENVGTGAANTYDGVRLEGTIVAKRAQVKGVTIDNPGNLRHGINVAAATVVEAIILDNPIGVDADYGTSAINDAGTGTIIRTI